MQTQPGEDIDAVLGRFEAWAGVRSAVEAKAGIRELTDEEALASGRYRWRGAGATPKSTSMGAVPAPTAAGTASRHEPPKTDSAKKRGLARRATKQAQAKSADARAAAATSTPAAAKAVPVPKDSAPRATFWDVLGDAVRPAEMVAAQPAALARQVAISIRLAPAERALIKTRAAEAGVSASAYMRQCALEVEQLREQVRQAIAAMERGGAVQIEAPAQAPGLFSRIARRIFSGGAQSIAVRA